MADGLFRALRIVQSGDELRVLAKEERALGQPLKEIWSDVWADIRPLVDSAMSGTSTWSEDMPLTMLRNGYPEETYWTFSYTPVRDEASTICGFLNITTDVTRKVQNERRLRADVDQFGRMFEQAPSFIAIMRGPDHVHEFVNAAHRRLFNSQDWIGRPIREAFPDVADQGFFELLDQVYETGEKLVFAATPVRYRRDPEALEETRYFDFVYAPIMDDRTRRIDETNSALYGREAAEKVHKALHEVGGLEIPREFVFMDRAAIGLGAVFLHLNAEINWYRLFMELIADFDVAKLERRQSEALMRHGLPLPG